MIVHFYIYVRVKAQSIIHFVIPVKKNVICNHKLNFNKLNLKMLFDQYEHDFHIYVNDIEKSLVSIILSKFSKIASKKFLLCKLSNETK